jgi:hypothetical protein
MDAVGDDAPLPALEISSQSIDGVDAHPSASPDQSDAQTSEPPEAKRATLVHESLPLGWTQLGVAPGRRENDENFVAPADRIRYPHDVCDDLNTTDDEIVLVGTAGQKITLLGPDFSQTVNPQLQRLVLRSHLLRKMEGLQKFSQLKLLELYDNQIEELACLNNPDKTDSGESGGIPGRTLVTLDMSYNMIRDMSPVQFCPVLQELCKLQTKM